MRRFKLAQLLFGLTSRSATTIVVGNGKTPSAHMASDPGVLAPTDFTAPNKLYDTLTMGATIVVTDLPLVRKNANAPVFQNQRRAWPSEER